MKKSNIKNRPANIPEISGLPERLEAIRKVLDLTQDEMGAQIGTDQSTISWWENGKTNPSLTYLRFLAGSHKVNLYWLFFGEGDMISGGQPAVEMTDRERAELLQENRALRIELDGLKKILLGSLAAPVVPGEELEEE